MKIINLVGRIVSVGFIFIGLFAGYTGVYSGLELILRVGWLMVGVACFVIAFIIQDKIRAEKNE